MGVLGLSLKRICIRLSMSSCSNAKWEKRIRGIMAGRYIESCANHTFRVTYLTREAATIVQEQKLGC